MARAFTARRPSCGQPSPFLHGSRLNRPVTYGDWTGLRLQLPRKKIQRVLKDSSVDAESVKENRHRFKNTLLLAPASSVYLKRGRQQVR